MSPISSGILCAASHGPAVMQHVRHRDRERGVITQHDHPQRIPNEDGIDAGVVYRQRRAVIVGCEHGDRFTTLLHFAQGAGGDFLALINGIAFRHGYLLP